jgi:hypothetical protein
MAIKDSGERRSFDTGAVRDIQGGKGRPSLMPLEVVYMLTHDIIIYYLGCFKDDGDTLHLCKALLHFARKNYNGSYETMLLEVSKHFEEGAAKYGDNNWQKGIPANCYMDSAIRHYLKYRRGDQDEPHDRAFVWNVMCCIWEVDCHDKD